MYQLIIHWDNARIQEVCGETKQEVYNKFDQLKVNPEEAIWELKWVPNKNGIKEATLANMMGKVKGAE